MAVVFFHQNEVTGAQGGIERYLSTLLDEAGDGALLITEACTDHDAHSRARRVGTSLPLHKRVPKWLSYVMGVALAVRRVRRAIRRLGPCTLEFSRPEYVLVSWMFKGTKVFTIHGTGPARSERAKYWFHYASCLTLPLAADVVQVVGRDKSGLPPRTQARLSTRLRYIDAWYDNVFRVTPFPELKGQLRVFFAGRLAPMKNPELLFSIIKSAHQSIEFQYFGADEHKIPEVLRGEKFRSLGLLNAEQIAKAISDCHIGILCSGYGEGSPFIVVEALASGRGFILPPLQGLIDTYQNYRGVVFAAAHTVDAYVEALQKMEMAIRNGLTPEMIANDVSGRNKLDIARQLLLRLEADHHRRSFPSVT